MEIRIFKDTFCGRKNTFFALTIMIRGKEYLITLAIFLAILIHVRCEDFNPGCNLDIIDGNQTITSSVVCTTEYNIDACKILMINFHKEHMPKEFTKDVPAISKPESLHLSLLASNFTDPQGLNYILPGLQIQWSAPQNEEALKKLEGFFFTWSTTDKMSCRMFHIKHDNLEQLKKVKFIYNIVYVKTSSIYTVKLYSIPLPENTNKDNSEYKAEKTIRTFSGFETGVDPGNFQPRASIQGFPNGTISVWIVLPPAKLGLSQMEVLLIKLSHDPQNSFQSIKYTAQPFTLEQPEGLVQFTNLSTDYYSAVIRYVDPYFNDGTRCVCWVKDPVKYCKNACGNFHTGDIFLNVSLRTSWGDDSNILPWKRQTTSFTIGGLQGAFAAGCLLLILVLLLVLTRKVGSERNPQDSFIVS